MIFRSYRSEAVGRKLSPGCANAASWDEHWPPGCANTQQRASLEIALVTSPQGLLMRGAEPVSQSPPSLHAHLQPWSKVWLFPQREQLLSGRIRADPARNCLRDNVWIIRSDWTMMMITWTDVRRKTSRDSLFYSSPSIQERCVIRSADEVLSRVRGQQTCKAIICWSG